MQVRSICTELLALRQSVRMLQFGTVLSGVKRGVPAGAIGYSVRIQLRMQDSLNSKRALALKKPGLKCPQRYMYMYMYAPAVHVTPGSQTQVGALLNLPTLDEDTL